MSVDNFNTLKKGDAAIWTTPEHILVACSAVKPNREYRVTVGNVYPESGLGPRAHITLKQRGIEFSCSRPLSELRKA